MKYNYDQCPECGYTNNLYPDVCPSCGYDLLNYRQKLEREEKAAAKRAADEAAYKAAISLFLENKFQKALAAFLALGNYKDSADYVEKAKREVEKFQQEQERLRKEKTLQEQKQKQEREAQEKRQKYERAKELCEQSNYAAAIKIFESLGNYEDAAKLLEEAQGRYRAQLDRQRAISEAIAEENRKKARFLLVVTLIVFVAIIVTIVLLVSINQKAKYSEENIVITIVNRVAATENSTYKNGYITAFEVKIQNNSKLSLQRIEGKLVIYNAKNEVLDTSDCTFSGDLASGEEKLFNLHLDRESSDKAFELYYADLEDLSATFQLTKVIYEDYNNREYTVDPVSILALSGESDGISTIEKSYQEALFLYNQEKYTQAMEKFDLLGGYKESASYYYSCIEKTQNAEKEVAYQAALALWESKKYGEAIAAFSEIQTYKESYNYIDEIITTGLSDAERFANTGDYEKAYDITSQLNHKDFADKVSKMNRLYAYARDLNFSSAAANGLKVIILPEGIETIPNNYFKNTAIEKIVIPSSTKYIGKSAFEGCTKLKELDLPEKLLVIEDRAFVGCTSLKTVYMPNSVTKIGQSAFMGCGMSEITLSTALTTLGSYAFAECKLLTSVTIPGKVKNILNYTFQSCTTLTSVSFLSGVETIQAGAFSKCALLSSISLPDTLLSIGEEAFKACGSLTNITIPATVTTIGRYAFQDCSSLSSVDFENKTGWTTSELFSPAIMDYIIIDVTDTAQNATRFRSTTKYYNATWTRSND